MQADRRTRCFAQFAETTNMVNMCVRGNDGLERQVMVCQSRQNLFHFVTGINNDGFAGLFCAEQCAVALQQSDGKGFDNHEGLAFEVLTAVVGSFISSRQSAVNADPICAPISVPDFSADLLRRWKSFFTAPRALCCPVR
jgi:hypothetical protein